MQRHIALAATAFAVASFAVVSAAAVDPAAASSRAVGLRLVIECKATVAKQALVPARGPCTLSGALSDRGRFVDDDRLGVRPHLRTLYVSHGMIELSVGRAHGGWSVIGGTRTYAGLRGRGSESRSWVGCGGRPGGRCDVYVTMTGTVSR